MSTRIESMGVESAGAGDAPECPMPHRDVLFIPDLAAPQDLWREWRTLFEKAGYRTLAPEVRGGRPEHFVERTAERMLDLIDEREAEPHLIGVGHGALVALCVIDELADRSASPLTVGAVAVGGQAIPMEQLGIRAERAHPILLIGGEQDPELPLAAMRARRASYASAAVVDVELLTAPGTAHALAFGDGWRETSAAALAFCNGLTRSTQRRRRARATDPATSSIAPAAMSAAAVTGAGLSAPVGGSAGRSGVTAATTR